jgi:hypothetical protein
VNFLSDLTRLNLVSLVSLTTFNLNSTILSLLVSVLGFKVGKKQQVSTQIGAKLSRIQFDQRLTAHLLIQTRLLSRACF